MPDVQSDYSDWPCNNAVNEMREACKLAAAAYPYKSLHHASHLFHRKTRHMKIYFGLHLDGLRGWHARNHLGQPYLGPLGLLSILETQLGLLRQEPSQAQRVAQYLSCLQQLNHPARFYHQSFSADALGVAATLLAWRDLWHLHGWQRTFNAAVAPRLRDMAEIEALAENFVSPCVGERLARIAKAMQTRSLSIAQIILLDPLVDFPLSWRKVLTLLPIESASVESAPLADQSSPTSVLSKLQDKIAEGWAHADTREKLVWQDDGSVLIVQAETRLLAGRWLGEQLRVSADSLILAEGEAALLDAHLAANNQPRLGFAEISQFRPALQVLPLVLELLWQPLNYTALLQFLTHAIGPIPAYARYKLAAAVADKPGMTGAAWQHAMSDIADHFAEDAHQVVENIDYWVQNPRFNRGDGVPIDVLLARVMRLAHHFNTPFSDHHAAHQQVDQAALTQIHAFTEVLSQLHNMAMRILRPHQIQKLLELIHTNSEVNPLWFAQAGACAAVTQPGAVVESFERIVWWQMAHPIMPMQLPWSQSELDQLGSAGVDLPNHADALQQATRAWLKPILAARKQLVLVLPPPGVELHPAWLQIKALFERLPVHNLEFLLHANEGANRVAVPFMPLPIKRRWWKLPAGSIPARNGPDSFSSLELQIYNPYQWALKYPASLKASRLLYWRSDFRLLGNLAHRLIECYFNERPANLNFWFEAAFSKLIEAEGATLLMPGRYSDLIGFQIKLRKALKYLQSQLDHAGIVQVYSEYELTGHFQGGPLCGYADLVVMRADGQYAVIDMKWAGNKYGELLQNNRHLQLAIYAELLRQNNGAWPQVAYFILDKSQLLALDNYFFTHAQSILKKTDENTPQLWLRFNETWQWRREQMDNGQLEVLLEEIVETEASRFPENGLTIQYLNPAYNDYLALAGWEE